MERIAWHPAFVEAIQLELEEYRDFLEFMAEYQLTSEPLQMDVLIVKKVSNVKISKNIGQIFQKYNVIEYKSPENDAPVSGYGKTQSFLCVLFLSSYLLRFLRGFAIITFLLQIEIE